MWPTNKTIKDFDSFNSLIDWDGVNISYLNEGLCSTDRGPCNISNYNFRALQALEILAPKEGWLIFGHQRQRGIHDDVQKHQSFESEANILLILLKVLYWSYSRTYNIMVMNGILLKKPDIFFIIAKLSLNFNPNPNFGWG